MNQKEKAHNALLFLIKILGQNRKLIKWIAVSIGINHGILS